MLAGAGAVLIGICMGAFYRLRKSGPPARPLTATTSIESSAFMLSGKIRPAHIIVVNPDVAGIIDQFEVKVGDGVIEGQELAQVGEAAQKTRRAEAADALEKAHARVEAAEKSVSVAQADALRARHDAQRIHAAEERVEDSMKQLDAANKNLADCNEALEDAEYAEGSGAVLAPADGIVVARNGKVGQPSSQLTGGLFQIGIDLYDLEVAVNAAPALLHRLKPEQAALIIIPALQGTRITGQVKEIRDRQVVVGFKSENPAIRPGMVAQVGLQSQ